MKLVDISSHPTCQCSSLYSDDRSDDGQFRHHKLKLPLKTHFIVIVLDLHRELVLCADIVNIDKILKNT